VRDATVEEPARCNYNRFSELRPGAINASHRKSFLPSCIVASLALAL